MEDVPRLLNRLAAQLRSMGRVEIQDITYHSELTEDGIWSPAFTVYFHPAGSAPAKVSRVGRSTIPGRRKTIRP